MRDDAEEWKLLHLAAVISFCRDNIPQENISQNQLLVILEMASSDIFLEQLNHRYCYHDYLIVSNTMLVK